MGALCCKPEQIDFDAPVDLWHFYLLRSVGKGAFGKVRVVQHKQTKALYALKYINKQRCIKQHAVPNIIQERRLLEEIECPFVCNLRYAFQDDENLFMVLDLMLGGDLRFHLERTGFMQEDAVRFIMAELAIALDYLHSKGIVHRDVKPDNILLDERGNAHLTDFNIAVHFTERRALTSIAGSMAYMAPEVLLKRGYTYTVDWWSLGVTGWELLFGKRPFRGKTNSNLTLCILKDSLKLPENKPQQVSDECMSFLKGLLERDYHKRLGCKPAGGLEALKKHPWMKGMDWDALEAKRVVPPFQPDSKKANFDATHELEELLLEDNPLKAKKRNPKNDINTMSAEMRMMEETFLVYDHTAMSRKSWFPDPHTQTQSSTQGNGQLLSIGDQPLASRVNTPIGQNTSTTGGGHLGESSSSTAVGGRPTSSQLVDSPRRSNNNNVNGGQFHHQHSYGSSSFQNHPIELAERVQNSNDDARPSDTQQNHTSSINSSSGNRPLRPNSPYHRHNSPSKKTSLTSTSDQPPLPVPNSTVEEKINKHGEDQILYINRQENGLPSAH